MFKVDGMYALHLVYKGRNSYTLKIMESVLYNSGNIIDMVMSIKMSSSKCIHKPEYGNH